MQRDTACKGLLMKMIETKRTANRSIVNLCILLAFLFAMTGCSAAKTAPEMFQSLCEVPEAAFEKKWNAAMKAVKSKGLTDDWNKLTSTVSAYIDYLDAPDLMEVCDPSDPKHPKTSSPSIRRASTWSSARRYGFRQNWRPLRRAETIWTEPPAIPSGSWS